MHLRHDRHLFSPPKREHEAILTMDIITKPYREYIVHDIDVEYLGGGTSTLTLHEGDMFETTPLELIVTLKDKGLIHMQRRNVCWFSVRTRTVQEPLSEPPTPSPRDPSNRPAAE